MGKDGPNPTIRILMLGNAGVGKNCLESRFTTMTYPPPYNPALTLNSRRYFTLPPIHAVGDCEPEEPGSPHVDSVKDKDKSDTQEDTQRPSTKKGAVVVSAVERPRTNSSTTSSSANPAAVGSPVVDHPDNTSISFDDRTLVASSTTTASLCSACARENNTYLVEVINYPALQSAAARRHVHARADYDAVLLVYDVCDPASFDAIPPLHAEIPVCTRKNHHQHHRRAVPHASATRSRTSGWFGGGGNETGTTGSGEIVVGLVGNKSDVDDVEEEGEATGEATGEAKMSGAVQASNDNGGPAEENLLHPLYRESILYEELMVLREERETQKAARAKGTKEAQSRPAQTPTTPFPTGENENSMEAASKSKIDDIQKWLQISRPETSLPLSPLSPTSPVSPTMLDGDYFGLAGTVADIKKAGKPRTSKKARQREVPATDGVMLAQALQLPVPFLETSARSGRHVELALENLVRAVLREMGRDASGTNKAGKTCRHRERLPKDKQKERRPSHTFISMASPKKVPVAVIPSAPPTPSVHDIAVQRPESAAMFRQADDAVEDAGVQPGNSTVGGETIDSVQVESDSVDRGPIDSSSAVPPPMQRRESVMGRMRKVFWRKSQQQTQLSPGAAMPADIAV